LPGGGQDYGLQAMTFLFLFLFFPGGGQDYGPQENALSGEKREH
jgi:hypothetical protein